LLSTIIKIIFNASLLLFNILIDVNIIRHSVTLFMMVTTLSFYSE